MKKLIIISSLFILLVGCGEIHWSGILHPMGPPTKCKLEEVEWRNQDDRLKYYGNRTANGYFEWKCEVRKDPKDIGYIKNRGRFSDGKGGGNLYPMYRIFETEQRVCNILHSKGKKCLGYIKAKTQEQIELEKQISSSLPTDHYELLYNDGTIINLPRFENDTPKSQQ